MKGGLGDNEVKAKTMLIRPATVADVPGILEIYNEAVLNTTASYDYDPVSLEARTAWYHEHVRANLPVFVAEAEDGSTAGWSALNKFRDREGYRFTAENSVYVAPHCRGQGIGRLLLTALIEAGRETGLHVIVAGMDSENEVSIRLHAAFGFEPVAYMPEVGYKFGRWLDVVFYQLILHPD